MKFSVPAVNRKCHSGRIDGGFRAVQAWLGASLALFAADGARAGEGALPRPHPLRPAMMQAVTPPADPGPHAAASACRLALDKAVALAPSVAPVAGPGDCGGDDLVRLEAVVLADSRHVALDPPALLRCEMAAAVAAWVRTDVASLAEAGGARLTAIEVAESFSCRGRNREAGAKLSEHGRANAIDIRALRLDGAVLTLPEPATPRALRVQLMASMCGRFTTVLGPGSDGSHEDHIHLDRRERRNGYRICQWTIEDEASPPPEAGIAAVVPLPRPRPASARQARQQGQ